jgi:hypothetical protein
MKPYYFYFDKKNNTHGLCLIYIYEHTCLWLVENMIILLIPYKDDPQRVIIPTL